MKAYQLTQVIQALQLLIFIPFVGKILKKESEDIKKIKMKQFVRRARLALEDAIKIIRQIGPEWLNEHELKIEKNKIRKNKTIRNNPQA